MRQPLEPFLKKPLLSFLRSSGAKELKAFTEGLFKLISSSNPKRFENSVSEDQSILDALSRLLVGDETCCAIALSGTNILLATNKNVHLDKSITLTRYIRRLTRSRNNLLLQYRDVLIYECQGKKQIKEKMSKPFKAVRKRHRGFFQYELDEKSKEILHSNLIFTQQDHHINFPGKLENNISLKINLFKDPARISQSLSQLQQKKEIQLLPEIPIPLDPLKRRTVKLLRMLSLIVRSIWHDHHDPDEIDQLCIKQWPQFLNDSLTYELSKFYKNSINIDFYGHHSRNELLDFYDELVKKYFELDHDDFFELIKKDLDSIQSVPLFIKKTPSIFLQKFQIYFEDLIKVHAYVRKDAKNNGHLSKLLSKANLSKKDDVVVELIEGVLSEHAEMKLLDKHLSRYKTTENYYGITMLCCALCHHTTAQLKLNGKRVAHTRGAHGSLYPTWRLIDAIKKDEFHLKQFLGETLYMQYCSLKGKKIPRKNNKKNPFIPGIEMYEQSEIALNIIASLASLNDEKTFKSLGFSEKIMLTNLEGPPLYPRETKADFYQYEAELARYKEQLLLQKSLKGDLKLSDFEILQQYAPEKGTKTSPLYQTTKSLMLLYQNLLAYQYSLQQQSKMLVSTRNHPGNKVAEMEKNSTPKIIVGNKTFYFKEVPVAGDGWCCLNAVGIDNPKQALLDLKVHLNKPLISNYLFKAISNNLYTSHRGASKEEFDISGVDSNNNGIKQHIFKLYSAVQLECDNKVRLEKLNTLEEYLRRSEVLNAYIEYLICSQYIDENVTAACLQLKNKRLIAFHDYLGNGKLFPNFEVNLNVLDIQSDNLVCIIFRPGDCQLIAHYNVLECINVEAANDMSALSVPSTNPSILMPAPKNQNDSSEEDSVHSSCNQPSIVQ